MTDETFPDESIHESGIREVTEQAVRYDAPADLVAPVDEAVWLAESLLHYVHMLNSPEQPAVCRSGCTH